MKKFNKIISVIISVIILISAIPLSVSAVVDGKCGENVWWSYDGISKTLTIFGEGDMYDYTESNYFIRNGPDWSYINRVEIKEGVTSIGDYAFADCRVLREVILPDTIKKIGSYAFYRCEELQNVVIPGSVVEMGEYIFSCCEKLQNVTISDGVTELGKTLFWWCFNIQSLKIPNSVEKIGSSFLHISKIIDFGGTSDEWETIVNNNKELNLQKYIVICQDEKVYPIEKCGDNVAWTIDELGTLTIFGNGEMYDYGKKDGTPGYGYNVKSIVVEDGVTKIGEYSFYGYDTLQFINIADSVKKIGDYAFSWCTSLKGVILSTETIGEHAFYKCDSLSFAVFNDGVKTIERYAFYECKNLSRITVGESVEVVEWYAFGLCHPKAVIDLNQNIGGHNFDFWRSNYNITIYYAGTEEQFWEKTNDRPVLSGGKGTVYFNSHLHEWRDEIIEATCVENGYVMLTCKICGAKDGHAIAEPTGEHRYIHDVTPPTCTEHGYTQTTCEICDYEYLEYTANPTGHTFNIQDDTPPTCTAHGVTDYECETCGYEYWAYTANPTGHTFNEDDICEICGEKEVSTSHINTQMLSIDSVFAMVMNLLAKLFGIFTVA